MSLDLPALAVNTREASVRIFLIDWCAVPPGDVIQESRADWM